MWHYAGLIIVNFVADPGPALDVKVQPNNPSSTVTVSWRASLPITGPATYIVTATSRTGEVLVGDYFCKCKDICFFSS